jgi:aerobic-type carbon monoxide dehydrogenase small subunit (CoxS/CutS family)
MPVTELSRHVNGISRTLTVDPRMSLLDLLRERLGLPIAPAKLLAG